MSYKIFEVVVITIVVHSAFTKVSIAIANTKLGR